VRGDGAARVVRWRSALRPLVLGRRVAVCWGGTIRTPFPPRPSIVTATVAAAGTAALRPYEEISRDIGGILVARNRG